MSEYNTLETTIIDAPLSPDTNIFAQVPTLATLDKPLVTGTPATQLKEGHYIIVRIQDPDALYADMDRILHKAFPEYAEAAQQYQEDVEELERLVQQEAEGFEGVEAIKIGLLRRTIPGKLRRDIRGSSSIDKSLARSMARQTYNWLNEEHEGNLDEQYQRRIRDWLLEKDTDDPELYELFKVMDERFGSYSRRQRVVGDTELEKPEILEKLPALVEAALRGQEPESFGQYTPEHVRESVGYFLDDDKTLMLARVTGFSDELREESYAELVPFNKDGTVPEGVNYRPLAKVVQDAAILYSAMHHLWVIAGESNLLDESFSKLKQEFPGRKMELYRIMIMRFPIAMESGFFSSDSMPKGNYIQRMASRAAELFGEPDTLLAIEEHFGEQDSPLDILGLETLFNTVIGLVPRDFYDIERRKSGFKDQLAIENSNQTQGRAQRRRNQKRSKQRMLGLATMSNRILRDIDALVERFGEEAGTPLNFESETVDALVDEVLSLYAPQLDFTEQEVINLLKEDYRLAILSPS